MQIIYNIITLVLSFVAFFICLSVHEAAHAFVANKLGDPTSKYEGRLSLNPLRHIDWFGTVLLPLFFILSGLPAFGWAKPVMVNINNFKNPPKDNFLTAISGPASNFLLAILLAIIVNVIPALSFLDLLIKINVILGLFNLLPIPPLDGSKVWHLLLSEETYLTLERYGPFILIAFLLFAGSAADYLFLLSDTISSSLINLF